MTSIHDGAASSCRGRRITNGVIRDWRQITVDWMSSMVIPPRGPHHARVARFLRDNNVDAIAVDRIGPGMQRMLDWIGILRVITSPGPTSAIVLPHERWPPPGVVIIPPGRVRCVVRLDWAPPQP